MFPDDFLQAFAAGALDCAMAVGAGILLGSLINVVLDACRGRRTKN